MKRDPAVGRFTVTIEDKNVQAETFEPAGSPLSTFAPPADPEGRAQWSAGYAHAMDRPVQCIMTRLVALGRLSEVAAYDKALKIDMFMREMNLAHDAASSASKLSPEAHRLVQAYADGFNYYLTHYPPSWELLLIGVTPELWTVRDSILLLKLMSYVPLAEIQRDVESFLVQAIKVVLIYNRLDT